MPPRRKPTRKNLKHQQVAAQRFVGLVRELDAFKARFPEMRVKEHEMALRNELRAKNPDFAKSAASIQFFKSALSALEKTLQKAELAIESAKKAGHPQKQKSLEIAQALRVQIFHTKELLQKIAAQSMAGLN